jgi:hypothetical protein
MENSQYQQNKVEVIKKGELVKRTPTAKTTFMRGDFCRYSKKYTLVPYNTTVNEVFVKKGTILFETWDTSNEDNL